MADLNEQQRQGLRDFQATNNRILTPTDYFLAGVAFQRSPLPSDAELRELAAQHGCHPDNGVALIRTVLDTYGVVDTGTPGWVGSPADRDLEAIKVALTWVPLDRRPREAVERVRAALVAAHAAGVKTLPGGQTK